MSFATAFSHLGTLQAKKNAFSGGSYNIESGVIKDIDLRPEKNCLVLDVKVKARGLPDENFENIIIPFGT